MAHQGPNQFHRRATDLRRVPHTHRVGVHLGSLWPTQHPGCSPRPTPYPCTRTAQTITKGRACQTPPPPPTSFRSTRLRPRHPLILMDSRADTLAPRALTRTPCSRRWDTDRSMPSCLLRCRQTSEWPRLSNWSSLLPPAATEQDALAELAELATHNAVHTSMIGLGYYGTITPAVIQRNVLENPSWYPAYTPYQPEISQGRLEAMLNFQTMIADLTGLATANASMLDEGSAVV